MNNKGAENDADRSVGCGVWWIDDGSRVVRADSVAEMWLMGLGLTHRIRIRYPDSCKCVKGGGSGQHRRPFSPSLDRISSIHASHGAACFSGCQRLA